MSSDARNRANKLNSQKSTGPRTEAGQQRSCRNSLKHGLCAQHVLLPSENSDMLDAIRNDLIEQYQPATNWELRLIDQAAMSYFRVVRSRRYERGLFDLRLRYQTDQANEFLDEQCEPPNHHPDPDEGVALVLYTDDPKRLQNFFRYNAAAEREYYRTLRELDLARKHRPQAQATKSENLVGFVPQPATQESGVGSLAACALPPSDPPPSAATPINERETPLAQPVGFVSQAATQESSARSLAACDPPPSDAPPSAETPSSDPENPPMAA